MFINYSQKSKYFQTIIEMAEEKSLPHDANSTEKTDKMPIKSRLPDTDMKRRFGAVAFVENIADSDDEGSGEEVLSLDSLRVAFASLEGEEDELTNVSFPDIDKVGVREIKDVDENSDFENTAEFHDLNDSVDFMESEIGDGMPIQSHLEADAPVELNPKNILEAMLFVGDRENRPLNPERAAEKMRNVTVEEIDRLAARLNEEYRSLGCPYWIQKDKEGYRMVLRSEFHPILEKFYGKIREAKLSQQSIDTLAIVAYRQPITAEEVQKIRKQPSTAILAQLMRRGLLELIHDIRDKKKITYYRTTERFLELFQLDSIDDLPISEEIEFR